MFILLDNNTSNRMEVIDSGFPLYAGGYVHDKRHFLCFLLSLHFLETCLTYCHLFQRNGNALSIIGTFSNLDTYLHVLFYPIQDLSTYISG